MSSSMSSRVSTAQLSLVNSLCEENPSPRAVAVSMLLAGMTDTSPFVGPSLEEVPKECAEQYLQLPAPCDHYDHRDFTIQRMVSEHLKKVDWLPLGVDTKQRALTSFRESESHCAMTNARIIHDNKPSWFTRAVSVIAKVLGPLDWQALNSIEELMHHGPGSSVGVQGDGSVVSDKYEFPVTSTSELLPFAESIMGTLWVNDVQCDLDGPEWTGLPIKLQSDFEVKKVRGSKWTSVPKNAKTDRGIAKEPTLNVFAQLGIGSYIRDRLKRFGVDLTSQEWSSALAEYAMDWKLATIDLSQASDLISYEVVRSMLPWQWFKLLCLTRSAYCEVDGTYQLLEKFSTMGNGYTFPLESLIFYAVVRAIVPHEDMCVTAVYGDDIVVPQSAAHDLIDALEYLGFKVNGTKSFLAGNFFESCGTDFRNGRQCRPFFATSEPGPVPKSVRTANGLRVWLKETLGYCDASFRPIWEEIVSQTPSVWRKTCVPPSWGDVGIIRDEPIANWHMSPGKPGHGFEGYLAKAVQFVGGPTLDPCNLATLMVWMGSSGRKPWYQKPWWQTDSDLPKSDYLPASSGIMPRKGLYGRPVARLCHAPVWQTGWEWL